MQLSTNQQLDPTPDFKSYLKNINSTMNLNITPLVSDMKKCFYYLLLASFSLEMSGQQIDPEKLMTRRFLSCQDIFYNVSYLIPEYYGNGSLDTLNSLMEFWETNCGMSEPLIRCKILFAIDAGNFDENLYTNNIIDFLFTYKQSKRALESNYNFYNPFYNQQNFSLRLDNFTKTLAENLLHKTNLNPVERFFVEFYSDMFDKTFSILDSEKFAGTKIQEYYNQEINVETPKTIGHGSFFAGIWIPQNYLKIIGIHPAIGFSGGIKYKRLFADATLSFRFIKSPNTYLVEKDDSIWNTTHFFGGYIGLDMGYNLLTIKNECFDLLGGIAFDGFDALSVKDKNSNNDISKSINTLNLNVGLGYKHLLKSNNYVGFDLKYNFVDYKNLKGTNLSGNTITINLIYGFHGPYYSNFRRRQLD